MINKSLKPLIKRLRKVKDQGVKDALCDSLIEMCDELISKGEKNDSKARNADNRVRL
jgi:predicted peroxiredoxin